MRSTEWQEIKRVFSAAFDLPEADRPGFLSNYDTHLRVEVEKLLWANDTAEDFIDEPAIFDAGLIEKVHLDPLIGEKIDDYIIVREIGRGGMGTVYLARRSDESFEKEVAIKLVKRGMDTNAVLKRFMVERQILAQLDHPNIAGLIDGGTTSEGLPYFVMEYVDGVPITKFCGARNLSINERLELFQKVCSAISYAHTNLVVHRDIKPSNILVTKNGTSKLLDFGIAKLLHPDWSLDTAEATATMFRIMTPEYASPEQIRGLPITTASDVYSLGVVLYELLSGERPYRIESRLPQDVAQFILTAEPVRPSAVGSWRPAVGSENTNQNNSPLTINEQRANPRSQIQNLKSLRGDLDNIILKALRKEPERRYASVQEFSEDIRRHLAGLPVTATADTTYYRLNKFIKRHRVGVFASTLIAFTLLAATAITAWQAVVAKRERDLADLRFNEVRQLTHTVLFEYYDQIIKLPGSTPLLEKMVQDTAEYLDKLAVESGGDPSLQSEIATAYQKIGDVQGNPYQGNLGNVKGAITSYQKSLAIREKLVAENPSDVEMRRALAKSYESSGDMLWTTGEYSQALDNYQKSYQIHVELADAESGTVEDGYEVARARHRIGQAQSRIGDLDSALENFRLGQAKFQEIMALAPSVGKYRRGLGSALCKIGDIAAAKNEWQTALENHRQALDLWSQLSAAEPLKANLKRDVTLGTDRVATDLEGLGNLPEALKTALRAVEIQEEIAAADPKNVQFESELGLYYVNLGSIQGKLKDASAAQKNVRNGLKILQRLADAIPQDMDLRRDLALSYQSAGDVSSREGSYQEAIESYTHSAELLEIGPLRNELREKLAQNYRAISDIYQKTGRTRKAKEWFQKSFDVWKDS